MFESFKARQAGAGLLSLVFYAVCRWICVMIARVCWGLSGRGIENVPLQGGLLVVSNHESYLDPPCVGGLITDRHFDFIARGGLFRFKPLGWLISALNSVPIQESAGDAAAIREVLKRLEMGRVVLVFPEGARSPDGKLQEFKRGIALLVKKSRCPVLPAAIAGAYEAWPRSSVLPTPWNSRVRVVYGRPIPHDELMAHGADAALARLRREVEALRAEAKRAAEAGR